MKTVQAILLEKPISNCTMSTGCAKTKHFITIDWDGTISLCNRTASLHVPEFNFGNINEIKTLEEVFNHPNFVKLVERSEKLRKDNCYKCSFFKEGLCGGGGGCPFLAYISGNLYAVPPSCTYEKELIEMIKPYVEPYKEEAAELLEKWIENGKENNYI